MPCTREALCTQQIPWASLCVLVWQKWSPGSSGVCHAHSNLFGKASWATSGRTVLTCAMWLEWKQPYRSGHSLPRRGLVSLPNCKWAGHERSQYFLRGLGIKFYPIEFILGGGKFVSFSWEICLPGILEKCRKRSVILGLAEFPTIP